MAATARDRFFPREGSRSPVAAGARRRWTHQVAWYARCNKQRESSSPATPSSCGARQLKETPGPGVGVEAWRYGRELSGSSEEATRAPSKTPALESERRERLRRLAGRRRVAAAATTAARARDIKTRTRRDDGFFAENFSPLRTRRRGGDVVINTDHVASLTAEKKKKTPPPRCALPTARAALGRRVARVAIKRERAS